MSPLKIRDFILSFKLGTNCEKEQEMIEDIAYKVSQFVKKENAGYFQIKFENKERPLTFLDKKLNDVTDAYIMTFGKLAQEYAQSIGQIKAIAVKDGSWNEPLNIDNLPY